jgi:hypothetical protein
MPLKHTLGFSNPPHKAPHVFLLISTTITFPDLTVRVTFRLTYSIPAMAMFSKAHIPRVIEEKDQVAFCARMRRILCEEPLEHTLRGERILQLSCAHVSHEACFYEFIRESDSQSCPSCNAPLGLDSNRGGNVLDIGS